MQTRKLPVLLPGKVVYGHMGPSGQALVLVALNMLEPKWEQEEYKYTPEIPTGGTARATISRRNNQARRELWSRLRNLYRKFTKGTDNGNK